MPELTLTLYSGPNCRLCDQAEVMVQMARLPGVTLHKQDVTASLELKKQYGLRIPLLRREDTGAELGWPFDESRLREFVAP